MMLALDWKSVTPVWVSAALEPHGRTASFWEKAALGHLWIDTRHAQINGSDCSRVLSLDRSVQEQVLPALS